MMEPTRESWAVGITAMCAAVLAKLPDMVWLLLAVQLIDILSGVAVAFNARTLCSTIARKGVTKKVMMLILVALAYSIDSILGSKLPIGTACASYYAAMEILSITENAGLLGVPIAPAIRKGMDALKGDDKE